MIWKCKLSSVVRESNNLKFTALTLFLLGGQEERGESLLFSLQFWVQIQL